MKPSCNNSSVVHGISAGPIDAGRSGRGPVAGRVGPCQVARSHCKWRVFCATRWLCLRTHLYNDCVPFRHVSSKRADQRLTERRNPASTNLDRLSAEAIVRLMNREDSKIATAVAREIRSIARAVDAIVHSIQRGGRLFYLGAGSSGRLGVLDAAECAPTFGTSRKLVQALIAGGRRAVTNAVEGAEDSVRNGELDLRAKKLTPKDVVIGIAASGTTPYVLGALKYARKCKATTVAVTANRNMPVAQIAKILIAPEVGPEVLTGSTRLKAGTAQKMVLNMLSTAAMVRLGHAYENLMIDLLDTNEKLSERSVRILAEASGKDLSAAKHALRQSGHNLRVALVMLKKKVDAPTAKRMLKTSTGNLRRALGES
jgi:N-acetylmuramic acid 6-phosphate etherase